MNKLMPEHPESLSGSKRGFLFEKDGAMPWRVRLRKAATHAVLVWVVLLLVVPIYEAAQARIYAPQFGTPFIVGSSLIFAAPDGSPFHTHRLICISKRDGKRIWEKIDEKEQMRPCFVLNRQLIVVVGNDVETCDPDSGELKLVYRTGFEQDVYARDQQDGTVFVGGARSNLDYLTLVDCETWRALWEVPRICLIRANGQDVVLCEQATRVAAHAFGGGGYSLTDVSWVALSKRDGEVLWHCAPLKDAAAVGHYFLVSSEDTIQCLNERDGTNLNQFKFQPEPLGIVSLATRNQELLVGLIGLPLVAIHSNSDYFTLSVPELKEGKLSKDEWQRARVEGLTVKDDAYVYYSSIAADWLTTSMNRRDIKTGMSVELYREPVPPQLVATNRILRQYSPKPITTDDLKRAGITGKVSDEEIERLRPLLAKDMPNLATGTKATTLEEADYRQICKILADHAVEVADLASMRACECQGIKFLVLSTELFNGSRAITFVKIPGSGWEKLAETSVVY